MLTDREQVQLLERQARVYEVLDVATKPAQWLIGGVKLLLLFAFIVAVVVGTPIYYLVTGGTVTGFQVANAFLALGTFILFFFAPLYTLLGGVGYLYLLAVLDEHGNMPFPDLQSAAFFFLVIGYAWVPLKRSLRSGDEASRRPTDELETPRSPSPTGATSAEPDYEVPIEMRRQMAAELESCAADLERTLTADSDPGIREQIRAFVTKTKSFAAELNDGSPSHAGGGCEQCREARRLLGVGEAADAMEIRSAYRNLAKVWHPDRFSENDTALQSMAREQFAELQACYDHLQNHPPVVPLNEMLEGAVRNISAMNEEFRKSMARFRTGRIRTREEAHAEIGRTLALHEAIDRELTSILVRIRHECPILPTAELEGKIEVLRTQAARLREVKL